MAKKNIRYPLEVVKRQRKLQKRASMEKLAEKVRDLEDSENRLKQLGQELKESFETLSHAERAFEELSTVQATTAGRMQLEVQSLDSLRHKVGLKRRTVQAQYFEVQQSRAQRDEARGWVAEASRAVEAVERHHSKWKAEWAMEQARHEERQRSELAISAWLRNQEREG